MTTNPASPAPDPLIEFDLNVIADGLKAYSTAEERNRALRLLFRLDKEYPKVMARIKKLEAIPPAPSPGLREAIEAIWEKVQEAANGFHNTQQWGEEGHWGPDVSYWKQIRALVDAAKSLPQGEAKAEPPAVSPEDLATMDYGIGNYTRERGKLWDTWTRIKSTLAPPGAPTQTTKEST